MSEKVLGFKDAFCQEKTRCQYCFAIIDSSYFDNQMTECPACGKHGYFAKVQVCPDKDKVPVVSLEALKKWAKNNSHIDWAERDSFKLFKSNARLVALHQLLSWAEKEAKNY